MRRSQSAVEYLTTYGWAILIIGIAAAVLYSLNVFNPYTYAPKASAGSCFVVRTNLSEYNFPYLSGACTNELPQYVAQFNGQTYQYIASNTPLNIPNTNPITVTAWIYYKGNTGNSEGIFGIDWSCPLEQIIIYNNQLLLDVCANDGGNFGTSSLIPKDRWVFVAYTLSGTSLVIYENNNSQQFTFSGTYQITPSAFDIGTDGVDFNRPSFNGSIANIQVYNTSLSDNSIQALYQEGIGGVPIDLNNLVGWWPLNGNPNDYSGNGNNGAATNVIYTSNWYNGYSAP